jgi:hypothetical protein
MEFTVIFKADPGNAYRLEETLVGLDFLDQARQELALPDLRAEQVRHFISFAGNTSYKLTIDEQTARESGRFREACRTTVIVPNEFLNQFFEESLTPVKDFADSEVSHVRGEWKCNEPKLLNAWRDAGYPLEWGFEEKESNEESVDEDIDAILDDAFSSTTDQEFERKIRAWCEKMYTKRMKEDD